MLGIYHGRIVPLPPIGAFPNGGLANFPSFNSACSWPAFVSTVDAEHK
jgi:hypothetical protein